MEVLAWVKAVHIAASALLAGAFAFEILVLRRIAARADDAARAAWVRGRLRVLALCGLAAGAVTWLAWLAMLAVSGRGQPVAQAVTLSVLGTVIPQTTFGHAWSLRAALLVALAVLLLGRSGQRRYASAQWSAAVLSLLFVCSLAWSGHGVGAQALHALVDAVHLLAASVWLGMLPPLWLVVRRACAVADSGWTDLAATSARLFSLPGMIAVAVLALSGVGNALWLLDSPRDLVDTTYGRILLAKLCVFALMLMLAAGNRIVFTPAAQSSASQAGRLQALRRLRNSVLVEVALGAIVLVLVGTLGVTPPGSHGAHVHHMEDM